MSEIVFDQDQRLKSMARQIADFFRPYPEDEAAAGVALHINKFWTPRMRAAFRAMPDIKDGSFDPLLTRAAEKVNGGRETAGQG